MMKAELSNVGGFLKNEFLSKARSIKWLCSKKRLHCNTLPFFIEIPSKCQKTGWPDWANFRLHIVWWFTLGSILKNYRSSLNGWATFFCGTSYVLLLAEDCFGPHFGPFFSQTNRVALVRKCVAGCGMRPLLRRATLSHIRFSRETSDDQGCQIFLDTMYQKGGKWTKLSLNYQKAITVPNVQNIFQMA
jgi:hypothetical protein